MYTCQSTRLAVFEAFETKGMLVDQSLHLLLGPVQMSLAVTQTIAPYLQFTES